MTQRNFQPEQRADVWIAIDGGLRCQSEVWPAKCSKTPPHAPGITPGNPRKSCTQWSTGCGIHLSMWHTRLNFLYQVLATSQIKIWLSDTAEATDAGISSSASWWENGGRGGGRWAWQCCELSWVTFKWVDALWSSLAKAKSCLIDARHWLQFSLLKLHDFSSCSWQLLLAGETLFGTLKKIQIKCWAIFNTQIYHLPRNIIKFLKTTAI